MSLRDLTQKEVRQREREAFIAGASAFDKLVNVPEEQRVSIVDVPFLVEEMDKKYPHLDAPPIFIRGQMPLDVGVDLTPLSLSPPTREEIAASRRQEALTEILLTKRKQWTARDMRKLTEQPPLPEETQ